MDSLDVLPDDILRRIFCHIADSPKDYLNLTLANRRINAVANTISCFKAWVDKRPLVFNLYLDKELYKPELCTIHGHCDDASHKPQTDCELVSYSTNPNSKGAPIKLAPAISASEELRTSDCSDIDDGEDHDEREKSAPDQDCFYHRIFALLNAKHRNFSTLRFKNALLQGTHLTSAFKRSLSFNESLSSYRLSSLVELELLDCPISLEWLSGMMSQLKHIKILTLDNCCFIDPANSKYCNHTKKGLKQLRLIGDRTYRMSDSTFVYFAKHYPARVLDVSATRIEVHQRVIKRFYPKEVSNFDRTLASEYILSFPVILYYLQRNQLVTKRFIADRDVLAELTDHDIKRLRLSIEFSKTKPKLTTYPSEARA